jgi:hypothetical protein
MISTLHEKYLHEKNIKKINNAPITKKLQNFQDEESDEDDLFQSEQEWSEDHGSVVPRNESAEWSDEESEKGK